MAEYVAVAKVGEIPEGGARALSVRDRQIAVFHLNDRYYALDDYCPHMGESLSEGSLHDETVLCFGHLWAFKLADGGCLDVPGLEAETFDVRIEGDQIQVRLRSADELRESPE
ncbi:MAG: Rieske (2Fe-2S) protein [Planctomycetota bacterium]|jgi:nitrite reductase (NADH) small subunit/3-phenylpropionate/trans-cinnamate dioxygenase ferredoxin subunit